MEISNNVLAALVIVALIVSIVGTITTIEQMSRVRITGYQAQQVPGIANVSIAAVYELTAIQNVTDFGVLSPSSNLPGDYIVFVTDDNDCPEDIQGSWEIEKGCNSGGGTVTVSTANSQSWEGYPTGLRYAADMSIENSANTDIQVRVSASTSPSSWIGGTNPEFQVKGTDNDQEPGACTSGLLTTFNDLGTSQVTLCNRLSWQDSGSDMMNVSFRIKIPQDAPAEHKEVILTFYALAAT